MKHQNQLIVFPNTEGVISASGSEWDDLDNDLTAINLWLSSYMESSPHTFRQFKRQALRFLVWLNATKGEDPKLLPKATPVDLTNYRQFLANPRPINPDFLKKFGLTVQPFQKPQSRNSIRVTFAVLNKMFDDLRNISLTGDEDGDSYVRRNPCVLIKGLKAKSNVERKNVFTKQQWSMIWQTILSLPKRTETERKHYHRTRWMFALMYKTFLRREEVSDLTMSSHDGAGGFQQVSDDFWQIYVVGKGVKEAYLPCTPSLLTEFSLYRKSLGLSELPAHDEQGHVFRSVKSDEPDGITGQTVYNICKTIFWLTADRLRQTHPRDAAHIEKGGPHWIRHTGITHALDAKVDPRFVQAVARHSSLSMTSTYDHKAFDAVWQDMQKHDGDDIIKQAESKSFNDKELSPHEKSAFETVLQTIYPGCEISPAQIELMVRLCGRVIYPTAGYEPLKLENN